MQHIKIILWGFAFGVANIIPGVSGGTFALVLGFYERLLKDIEGINSRSIKSLWTLLKNKDRLAFQQWAKVHDFWFLVKLGAGAVLSIASLSSLMKYLLNNHFSLTYAFFFGLISLSVIVPWKLIRSKGPSVIVALIIACALTVGVSLGVDPVKKAEKKSDFYKTKTIEMKKGIAPDIETVNQMITRINKQPIQSQAFQWTSKYSTTEFVMALISGCLAVSAMVLPGISGSLLLILMGQYMIVIQAIANLKSLVIDDFVFLSIMSIGMVLGLFVTARVVKWALEKYHDVTMGALTGLIIGSLFVLWPFRDSVVRNLYFKINGQIVLKENVEIFTNDIYFPSANSTSMICLGMMILGIITMVFFLKNDPEAH